MFKIDWPCAIGGAFLGYYAKGRVETVKSQFKKISTDTLKYLDESFDKGSQQPTQQPTQPTQAGN